MGIPEEFALELLADLATANRKFLANALPNFPVKIEVRQHPQLQLVMTVTGELERAGYPNIVKIGAVLRPTAAGRRYFGLPQLEEERA